MRPEPRNLKNISYSPAEQAGGYDARYYAEKLAGLAHDSFVETDYAAYYHYYEYDDVYGHFKLYIIIFAKLLKMVVMAKN